MCICIYICTLHTPYIPYTIYIPYRNVNTVVMLAMTTQMQTSMSKIYTNYHVVSIPHKIQGRVMVYVMVMVVVTVHLLMLVMIAVSKIVRVIAHSMVGAVLSSPLVDVCVIR